MIGFASGGAPFRLATARALVAGSLGGTFPGESSVSISWSETASGSSLGLRGADGRADGRASLTAGLTGVSDAGFALTVADGAGVDVRRAAALTAADGAGVDVRRAAALTAADGAGVDVRRAAALTTGGATGASLTDDVPFASTALSAATSSPSSSGASGSVTGPGRGTDGRGTRGGPPEASGAAETGSGGTALLRPSCSPFPRASEASERSRRRAAHRGAAGRCGRFLGVTSLMAKGQRGFALREGCATVPRSSAGRTQFFSSQSSATGASRSVLSRSRAGPSGSPGAPWARQ